MNFWYKEQVLENRERENGFIVLLNVWKLHVLFYMQELAQEKKIQVNKLIDDYQDQQTNYIWFNKNN